MLLAHYRWLIFGGLTLLTGAFGLLYIIWRMEARHLAEIALLETPNDDIELAKLREDEGRLLKTRSSLALSQDTARTPVFSRGKQGFDI